MNKYISKEEIFSNKDLRQSLEIDMFLKSYNKEHHTDFAIFQRRDKPDYFIKDSKGIILGVELSSVYMDDKVVGTRHKKDDDEEIPYDSDTHEEIRNKYFKMILNKIKEKANKINNREYDTSYPIILFLYLNDYYTIHIEESEWEHFLNINKYFSNRKEFKQIILKK